MDDDERRDDGAGECRRVRTDSLCDNDGANRERDADAQSRDDRVGFRVVAIPQSVVPAIEHLGNRTTEADDNDYRGAQSSGHSIRSVTCA